MASKRKWLSLEEKVSVIEEAEKSKKSQRQLAEQFDVGKTQILKILKDREEIYKSWRENSCNLQMKKKVKTEAGEIDSIVYDWFCAVRMKKIPVTGPMLQEKAIEVAKTLGSNGFKASNGWLQKFKNRHEITGKIICGESGSVVAETVEQWKEKLAAHCTGYSEEDIYNVDETGLFYCTLPNKTLCFKNSKCSGTKISKKRITVMLCVNMLGAFEKPLIIGQSLKPRCFKGVKLEKMNIEWKANKKAWMNTALMTEFLEKFNRKMKKDNRKVVLFLDNAAPHPDLKLTNVKLVFFPPNTTSVCQPLDLGIIKNFKEMYKKQLLRHLISKIDKNESTEKCVTVLDAVVWTVSAVNSIKPTTVRKCFLKAGFQARPIDAEVEELESCCTSDLEELDELVQTLCPEMTGEEYLGIDMNLSTHNVQTDIQSIISNRLSIENDSSDEEEEISADPTENEQRPNNVTEAIGLVSQLLTYCKEEGVTDHLLPLYNLKGQLEKTLILKKKSALQTKISNFFSKSNL